MVSKPVHHRTSIIDTIIVVADMDAPKTQDPLHGMTHCVSSVYFGYLLFVWVTFNINMFPPKGKK